MTSYNFINIIALERLNMKGLIIFMFILMFILFGPTLAAFIGFVHLYNQNGFFDAHELECDADWSDDKIQNKIATIIDNHKNLNRNEKRFYSYVKDLVSEPALRDFTNKFPVYRQYDFWIDKVYETQ